MKQFRWKLLFGLALLLGLSGSTLAPLALVQPAYAASYAPARPAGCMFTSLTTNIAPDLNGSSPNPYELYPGTAWVGSSCNAPVTLVYQQDNNLVLYLSGRAYWSSKGNEGIDTGSTCAGDVEYDILENPIGPTSPLLLYDCHGSSWTVALGEGEDGNLAVQSDGNVVIYNGPNDTYPQWATGTNNDLASAAPATSCPTTMTREDMTLQSYMSKTLRAGMAWFARTTCNIPVELVYQADGNLVLYINGLPKWATGTGCSDPTNSGTYASFTYSGNLIVSCDGTVQWTSNTSVGTTGKLAIQGDGNVVIYNSVNSPVWASNTWCAPTPDYNVGGTCVS